MFGWEIRYHGSEPAFTDGSGHMIGHFSADLPVAGNAGARPYIYVESVDDDTGEDRRAGGKTATVPYAEGDLWVATFCDPAGNEVGVWQTGPREPTGGR